MSRVQSGVCVCSLQHGEVGREASIGIVFGGVQSNSQHSLKMSAENGQQNVNKHTSGTEKKTSKKK